MSIGLAVDAGLALLVIALAGWTIAARTTFAAIVGFVACGLLLALVWVRLAAVDVAMTEAAIGGGATGMLLLMAAARLRTGEAAAAAERPGRVLWVLAATLCVGIFAALAVMVLSLPEPAPSLAPLAVASLPTTGLGNPVTAVLMTYRAIDTLLETVVFLLALVGVWSLAPDGLWGGIPGPKHAAAPDGVLASFARTLAPVGIVIGIYVVWVGADAPGGKFQGGTVLAAMWILVLLAGLAEAPRIDRPWLRRVLVLGPAVFLAIGLAGFAMAGSFLAFPPGFAKPLIVLIEVALTVSVAATLALLVAGPPERTAGP